MTPENFRYIQCQMKQRTAIVLPDDKQYMVESRLEKLARAHVFANVDQLIEESRKRGARSELQTAVIESLIIHETFFFRDPAFAQVSRQLLTRLIEQNRRSRQLRIWSAACSTGQEPYSLAIILRENFPELADWSVEIIASDISHSALDKARAGRYSMMEVNRGLPTTLLMRHFKQQGLDWQAAEPLRRAITFKQINLVERWPDMPTFDLVLLRNVLIYLDDRSRQEVIRRVTRVLRPEGYLVLGASETRESQGALIPTPEFKGVPCYQRE